MQGATLGAIRAEQQDEVQSDSFKEEPAAMQDIVKMRLPALRRALTKHPQTLEQ